MINKNIEEINDYELMMLYQEEDEDIRDILFTKYKHIIDMQINKYKKYMENINIDLGEVYSECYIILNNAFNTYKDNKNASLKTFISTCIKRKIIDIIRKYNTQKYTLNRECYSLDFIYDEDNNLYECICDENKEPLKNITEIENCNELIMNIKEKLTKKENEVFSLMIKGFNYKEIAKILNKTTKQIDNTRERIKAKTKILIS